MSTIREKIEQNFFSDIHERLVDFLSGKISSKLSEQDKPDIDEYYVQEQCKTILENRVPKIENSLKIVRNKSHGPLKEQVLATAQMSFNPQIDIRILGSDYKMLYAVYEVKSRLQDNEINGNDIYADIQRLAIVKRVFPKVKCIFILPGLFQPMKNDFEKNDIKLPNTFNISGNPNYKRKGRYKSVDLDINISNTNHDVLKNLKVGKINVRLSQTAKGKKHILFTYEIKIKNGHEQGV
jgi:hypothetical protein